MEMKLAVIVPLALMLGYCYAVNPLTMEVLNGVPLQQSPCIGQSVLTTCTFDSGITVVTVSISLSSDTSIPLTVIRGSTQIRLATIAGADFTANFTSDARVELLISSVTAALNGSTITCETDQTSSSQSTMLTVIGSTSAPMYSYDSITQNSFSGLSVPVQRPIYGWECVDTYMVTAQSVNGDDTADGSVNVTDSQLSSDVLVSGVDMCMNMYMLTVVAISNGERSESFTLQGTYQPDGNALSNVISSTMMTQPLTTSLSWSLSSTPQPQDCVMNYTLSFSENDFSLSKTSVLPRELLTDGFPFCTNRDLKISPFIPTLGDVDSRSLTVTVRLEEGFESPEGINVTNFTLEFDNFNNWLDFGFRLQWTSRSRGDVTVGYSIGGASCEPRVASNASELHTFSSLRPQDFIGQVYTVCVRVRNIDCIRNVSSLQQPVPIAITATRPVPQEGNGLETTVTIHENVNSLNVTVNGSVDTMVTRAGNNMFKVSIRGLEDGTTYEFMIQALDANNNSIGVPITGIYPPQRKERIPPCGVLCITLIVLALLLLLLTVLLILPLSYKFRKQIRRCCSRCCKCSSEEETDTHELKSPADHNSVEHEKAPSGEEYAVVASSAKTKTAVDTFYQDPSTIEHEQAPETGDLYAVTDKKPKSKKAEAKTEAELAGMYSVPDRTKKAKEQGITYADIDMAASRGGDKAIQQPPQTEYATVVN